MKILIVGAGEAGREAVDEIRAHPEFGMLPMGFVDDDPAKGGTRYRGIRVLGTSESIAALVTKHEIEEILIAIPSATGREIRRLILTCQKARIRFKIVPGIREIITGAVSIKQIRDFRSEDLLGRESVDMEEYSDLTRFEGERILVTGAGGTIGTGLCRQLAEFRPAALGLVGHGENSIHRIMLELGRRKPGVPLRPLISDLKNAVRVKAMLADFTPDTVIHAAAHKHISFMENNPVEAAENNVLGTLHLADAAISAGASRFIFISSDKAVRPTSVMGVTKKIGEQIILAKSRAGRSPLFLAVRFGNVIGSRGSVVPIFQRQIEMGGPVTVSHPDARRYFMTVKEAARLVLHAGVLGRGGDLFTLDMGESIHILQLARELITLNGLEPESDIPITFTGLQPGEKLDEEILTEEEDFHSTKFKRLFISHPAPSSEKEIDAHLGDLRSMIDEGNRGAIIRKFSEMVPGYTPSDLHRQ